MERNTNIYIILCGFLIFASLNLFGQSENIFKLPYDVLEEQEVTPEDLPVAHKKFLAAEDLEQDGSDDLLYFLTGRLWFEEFSRYNYIILDRISEQGQIEHDTLLQDSSLHYLGYANVDAFDGVDIVYGNSSGIHFMANVSAQFATPVNFLDGRLLAICEANDDGWSDYVVYNAEKLWMVVSNGSMSYDEYLIEDSVLEFNAESHFIDVGDIDGDGDLDVCYNLKWNQLTAAINSGGFDYSSLIKTYVEDLDVTVEYFNSIDLMELMDYDKDGVDELFLALGEDLSPSCIYSHIPITLAFTDSLDWELEKRIFGLYDMVIRDPVWVETTDGFLLYFLVSEGFDRGVVAYYDFNDINFTVVLAGNNQDLTVAHINGMRSVVVNRKITGIQRREISNHLIRIPMADGRAMLNHHASTNHISFHQASYQASKKVAAGDLNGDGYPDIVSIEMEWDSVYNVTRHIRAYINDQNGGLQKHTLNLEGLEDSVSFIALFQVPQIMLADLDRNGTSELIINFMNDTVTVYRYDGDDTFNIDQVISNGLANQYSTIADVNNDSYQDLIIMSMLYLNDGSGQLVYDDMDVQPFVRDIDEDGLLDFYGLNQQQQVLEVRMNNGDLTTTPNFIQTDGRASSFPILTHLNSDSRLDLIAYGGNYSYGGYCIQQTDQEIHIDYQTDSGYLINHYDLELAIWQSNLGYSPWHTFLAQFNNNEEIVYLFSPENGGMMKYGPESLEDVSSQFYGDIQTRLAPGGLADMDLDGDLDLITYMPGSVGYLENERLSGPPTYVALSDTEEHASISIHPNPVFGSNRIQLTGLPSTGHFDATIYSIAGQRVFQKTLPDGKRQLAIPDLSPGIYTLQLSGTDRQLPTIPFVILSE